ncbi:MAG: putative ABC transporter permease subunit, partial [Planctomycetota bacterium]
MADGLRHLRWQSQRQLCNRAGELVCHQPLRALSMIGVIIAIAGAAFGVTWFVLAFLDRPDYRGLKPALISTMLGLFFFVLLFAVALSATVVKWSALFRSGSARFHAHLPVGERALYWHACLEGGPWASWAVLSLGAPVVLAIGREAEQPLLYVAAASVALLAFVACCLGLGACGAVLLARLLPALRRGARSLLLLATLAAVALILALIGSYEAAPRPDTFLRQVLGRVSFVDNPLLPPAWAGQAIDAALRADWSRWGQRALLLTSTAVSLFIL